MTLAGYETFKVYYGDLHNHCHEVGYGYGSIEEAYRNARSQLDFASVTAHAYWPDLPVGEPRLAPVVTYHQDGFQRAAAAWSRLQEVTEAVNEAGRFASFLSFEWHSMRYGDHNVYFRDGWGEIIPAPDLEALRARLRQLQQAGIAAFLIPHHIGYLAGYRGLNWADFSPEFSPVVEIFSMHGLAESGEAAYPYLHTMGPRDERSTMQHGLQTGQVFGVIGSTDHHSAFPGSYGYGRVAAWATELSRTGIWAALAARRTYALTGDRLELAFSVNGRPMGSILPATPERQIEVEVVGGGPLDYVELLHNNQVIQHWPGSGAAGDFFAGPVKVLLEVGWGAKEELVDWQVELAITGGQLVAVEPRFRGLDIVAPEDQIGLSSAFSRWERAGPNGLRFSTQTWGNPTVITPATQGVCLEVRSEAETRITGRINGRAVEVSLAELSQGARTAYLGGFLTPAYSFQRAVPRAAYSGSFACTHYPDSPGRDWYYVRVRQKNGQWAWSSPIWVEAA